VYFYMPITMVFLPYICEILVKGNYVLLEKQCISHSYWYNNGQNRVGCKIMY